MLGDKPTCIQSHKIDGISMVVDLFDVHEGNWNEEVVHNTFNEKEAQRILCIPLLSNGSDDKLRWCPDKFGEYTVRSGYQLLLRGFPGSNNDHYNLEAYL